MSNLIRNLFIFLLLALVVLSTSAFGKLYEVVLKRNASIGFFMGFTQPENFSGFMFACFFFVPWLSLLIFNKLKIKNTLLLVAPLGILLLAVSAFFELLISIFLMAVSYVFASFLISVVQVAKPQLQKK